MGAKAPQDADLCIRLHPLKERNSSEGAKNAMLAPRTADVKDWVDLEKSGKQRFFTLFLAGELCATRGA
jgi:hypothetical protein